MFNKPYQCRNTDYCVDVYCKRNVYMYA